MRCFEIKNKLNAWVDGEVSPQEAEIIESHLKQCPDCSLEAKGIQQLVTFMDALPDLSAPPSLSRKILKDFRQNLAKPGMLEWWKGMTLSMQSAFCGAAVAGLLFGAVLGSSIISLESASYTDPYQTLYVSEGIIP